MDGFTGEANGGQDCSGMPAPSFPSNVAGNRTLYVLVDYYGGDYQMSLIEATERQARKLGYDVLTLVGRSLGAPRPSDAVQNDIYRNVDLELASGVLVASGCMGLYVAPPAIRAFAERFRPVPTVSASVQLDGIPSLIVSNYAGMKVAIDHLIEQHQCRRIAYVRGPLASREAEERFEGYCASLAAHGIPFDPELVEVGDFWIDSGERAIRHLLDTGVVLDAIAAANDYMALGVMDVLRSRGVRVPHQIRVVGFDDAPTARLTSPSLTTIRQPLAGMGRRAVDTLHRMARRESVELTQLLDVELVLRQSCGCGYQIHQSQWPGAHESGSRPRPIEILANGVSVEQALLLTAELEPGLAKGWSKRLVSALGQEFRRESGRFLLELEDVLDELQPDTNRIERFYSVIEALRFQFRDANTEDGPIANLDDLWHAALLLVGDAARRSHLRARHEANLAIDLIRQSVEQLSTVLSHAALIDGLRRVFESSHVASASVALFADETRLQLKSLLVFGREIPDGVLGEPFPTNQLAPKGYFGSPTPKSYVALPITYGTDQLGIVVLETGAHPSIYTSLREHIGAALKGAALHRAVVNETSRRERAEREQLEKESLIAQRIQTAILPRHFEVQGLEIDASMQPAASVGGDYYEVVSLDDGGWLGIGDVAGHGLMAGMIMMMIQSMVRGSISVLPNASPKELVVGVNRAIFDNLRHRLGRDDYTTFCLIRFELDGTLTYAGCHESLIVWRARTGQCELIPTTGMWLGVVEDIATMTENATLKLERSDVLVLFTDGVTEAMNANHEQFGLERLRATVEAHARQSVNALRAAVESAISAWTASPIDDVTVLVARYTGNSAGS
jgi:DNA-binding LacI/PurR family transcriptional regulator/serine phosphatase RsbU (regulator of sigma subunit)